MDPYSFCGWHVRCSHRSDRSTLRILRWIWLHAQSVLCLIQPCSLCYFNGTVCASVCTGFESLVWLGAKQHFEAYCTYLIMSAVGNHQHTSCEPLHNSTAQGTQTTTVVLDAMSTFLAIAYSTGRAATQSRALVGKNKKGALALLNESQSCNIAAAKNRNTEISGTSGCC